MAARTPMAPTKPQNLLAAGLLAIIAGNVLTRVLYSDIPPIPHAAAVVFGLLGIAEFAGGLVLRGRIERRRGAPPVDPLLAARALILARASAFAGAVVAGAWVGLLVYTLPQSGTVTVASADSVVGGIGLLSALVLVGAALWLEHCCRAPDDQDRDSDAPDGHPRRPE